jgi:hypothetical protein
MHITGRYCLKPPTSLDRTTYNENTFNGYTTGESSHIRLKFIYQTFAKRKLPNLNQASNWVLWDLHSRLYGKPRETPSRWLKATQDVLSSLWPGLGTTYSNINLLSESTSSRSNETSLSSGSDLPAAYPCSVVSMSLSTVSNLPCTIRWS